VVTRLFVFFSVKQTFDVNENLVRVRGVFKEFVNDGHCQGFELIVRDG